MEQKVDELMEAHSGIQAQLNIRNEALIKLPKNLAAAIVGNDNEKCRMKIGKLPIKGKSLLLHHLHFNTHINNLSAF